MKYKYLIKEEDGKRCFVDTGEFGEIVKLSYPNSIAQSSLDYLESTLFQHFDPIKMFGFNGQTLSLPPQVHRLSGIDYLKTETTFILRLIEIDFETFVTTELKIWEFDVKQWPDGHVRITSYDNTRTK